MNTTLSAALSIAALATSGLCLMTRDNAKAQGESVSGHVGLATGNLTCCLLPLSRTSLHRKFLRPGMKGVGKVDIGQRKLIWIWTRSLIDWLKLALWSYSP